MHAGWTGAGVGPGPDCKSYRQVGRLKYFKNVMGLQTEGHDSKFEMNRTFDLEYLKKIGEVVELKRHLPIPLYVNGKKVCTYIADNFVTYKDGRQAIIETKGLKQPAFEIKWKLLEAIYGVDHPEIELRIELQARQRRW